MTAQENKYIKMLGFLGLTILVLVTSAYLTIIYISKEQISSPIFDVLIGLGFIALGMLIKFFIHARKKNNLLKP
jgi:hypothetical protein